MMTELTLTYFKKMSMSTPIGASLGRSMGITSA